MLKKIKRKSQTDKKNIYIITGLESYQKIKKSKIKNYQKNIY